MVCSLYSEIDLIEIFFSLCIFWQVFSHSGTMMQTAKTQEIMNETVKFNLLLNINYHFNDFGIDSFGEHAPAHRYVIHQFVKGAPFHFFAL